MACLCGGRNVGLKSCIAMNEECNVDVVKLEHDPPEDFGVCVCECGNLGILLFAAFRELVTLCYFSFVVIEILMTCLEENLKLYIFFHFWTQILLFLSSEFGTFGVARTVSLMDEDYNDQYWGYMPWDCKVFWALFSAALPSSILSCIVFWTQIYKRGKHILHILLNTVSPAVAVIDFIFVAFPLRFLHGFYFVLFYIIYIFFTLLYQKCGGTGTDDSVPIYKLLDWDSPGDAILHAFLGLAIGVGVYLFLCVLSMGKLAFRDKYLYY